MKTIAKEFRWRDSYTMRDGYDNQHVDEQIQALSTPFGLRDTLAQKGSGAPTSPGYTTIDQHSTSTINPPGAVK